MPLDLISNGQVIVWFTILQSVLLFCIFNPRTGYSPLSLLSYLISIPVIFNSSPCSAPPSTTPIHLPAYSVMATFQSFLPNANPIYNPSRHLRSRQDHRHRHHSRSTPSHNYFNKYSTKMRRLRPLPTAPTSFLSEEQKNKSALVALPVVDGRMAGLDNQLDLYQARERKKATVSDLSSAIQATTTVWQLYNHCSAGFVQTFMGITNANGRVEDVCLSEILV
uniref:Uncharacterized protein n=1 Tax=Ditylenchus dipsaci TaxID=166011 RepID=A0A915EBB2_9BILA